LKGTKEQKERKKLKCYFQNLNVKDVCHIPGVRGEVKHNFDINCRAPTPQKKQP
jgi:hypothetical protein